MPNIKSAKKRVLVNATKQARNKSANSALKTVLKKANAAIEANAEDSTRNISEMCSSTDVLVRKVESVSAKIDKLN